MSLKEFPIRHTVSTEGPQCPYCGYEVTADDSSYFDETGYTRDTCQGCGKEFRVDVFTETTWSCEPLIKEAK